MKSAVRWNFENGLTSIWKSKLNRSGAVCFEFMYTRIEYYTASPTQQSKCGRCV